MGERVRGLGWLVTFALGGVTACVGAFPQAPAGLGEDAELRGDAGQSSVKPPLESADTGTPAPSTAAPTQPGEPCVPDICRECGPEGARAPVADERCPPLDCSSLSSGRIETNARTAVCWLTTYSPSFQGRCEAEGRCAVPELNTRNCVQQPEFAAPSIQDTACARFVNCEGGNAQIMTNAEGTACTLDGVRGACDGRGACVAAPPPPPPAPTEPPPPPPPDEPDEGSLNCGRVGEVRSVWLLFATVCEPVGQGEDRACRYRFSDRSLTLSASCNDVCNEVGRQLSGSPFQCEAAWSSGRWDDCADTPGAETRCDRFDADLFCDCRP